MLKLYLHIGMPKTGTTYIQNFLRANNNVLKEKGYVYPDFGVRFDAVGANRNAHFLVSVIRDENKKRLVGTEHEIEDECFEKLYGLFEEYPNVIISEESIWNSAERKRDKNFWKNLKERLESHGISLKIIVYLRRQDLYIQSFWAQQIKESRFSDTLQEYINSSAFKRAKLDYKQRLDEISKVVGKENMLVRVYEKEQYAPPQKTIVSDFLKTVGLQYTDEYTELERLPNRSLSGVYLETMRELNKVGIFDVHNKYVQSLMKTVAENNNDIKSISSNEFMTSEETVEFLAKYKDTNDAVAREYLSRGDEGLFFEELKVSDEGKHKYTSTDYVRVLAQMLVVQNEQVCELREEIKELKEENKQLQSTVNWVTASFPKKVKRKLKRHIKEIFSRKKTEV